MSRKLRDEPIRLRPRPGRPFYLYGADVLASVAADLPCLLCRAPAGTACHGPDHPRHNLTQWKD